MNTNHTGKSTTLYYREGSSDKVYQAHLKPQGAGFVVNFTYGRRGSTMQSGTKTASGPVAYEAARKIFDKLVAEKTAKGYSPGADGTPYQQTDRESRATGILPQLLNAIDQTQALRLIADDAWAMQEKLDGKRILIQKADQVVTGINRSGLSVALPQPIALALGQLPGDLILDGECIGDVYHAFDLLGQGAGDTRGRPCRQRLSMLTELISSSDASAVIRLVRTVTGPADKQAYLAELRERKAEGAVFKRLDGKYTHGRPASGGAQVKFKFTATASCIVAGANVGKRSVALVVLDGVTQVPVGNVTIPPNQPLPVKGDLVEVRYLYAYEGGSLFHPVCLGKRDDIDAAACTLSQLKLKPASAGDEEYGT
ncbi:MAG: WGR domain-containing protein [Phycisphaeraceae bacterium]